jgi:hypothetical protein
MMLRGLSVHSLHKLGVLTLEKFFIILMAVCRSSRCLAEQGVGLVARVLAHGIVLIFECWRIQVSKVELGLVLLLSGLVAVAPGSLN